MLFFFFNDTATTEIYTLSLHDALPIWSGSTSWRRGIQPKGGRCQAASEPGDAAVQVVFVRSLDFCGDDLAEDRKSTRLNSSHLVISYAVFCLKKKKPERLP